MPSVEEFRVAAGMRFPKSRIAALCFDKIDAQDGLEVKSPSGQIRRFKYPWSILAWQIAGEDGRFVPAEAEAAEGVIRVRSEQIAHPARVRYAWTDWSDRVNLYGENGMPLEPFDL